MIIFFMEVKMFKNSIIIALVVLMFLIGKELILNNCISQVKSEPLRNSILNHPKIKSYSLVDSFFNHSSVSRIRKDGPFIFKTCDLCVNRSVNAAVNT